MKEALPQMTLIVVLTINFLMAVISSDRNAIASFIATVIVLSITFWGGFFTPLINYLMSPP